VPPQPTIETFTTGTAPFNAGVYERSFAIGTVGATIWFGGRQHATTRRTPPGRPAAPSHSEPEIADVVGSQCKRELSK
jgi:hypothetical protein